MHFGRVWFVVCRGELASVDFVAFVQRVHRHPVFEPLKAGPQLKSTDVAKTVHKDETRVKTPVDGSLRSSLVRWVCGGWVGWVGGAGGHRGSPRW
jgi:hypothetical protein